MTRVVAPNGFETTASYDARGNLASSTAWNPYGDDRNATTTYAWDPVWDAVTQVTAPEGEVTLVQYDSVGRREWEQAGPGDSRRVKYTYYPKTDLQAPGLLQSVTLPATTSSSAATQRFEYDARGNLAAVVSPMGVRTETASDRVGRAIFTKSPIDGTAFRYDSIFYDLADQVDSTVTRAGTQRLIVNNTQDEEGNLTAVSRRSDPDAASIGTITTRWEYDLAGRMTVEIAPDGMRDSTFYDKVGNAIRLRTRRYAESRALTDTDSAAYIRMRYDAVNRLTTRITPPVRYAPRSQGIAVDRLGTRPYPYYPNDGTGLYVPGDTVTLVYDAAGSLTQANNHDAWVRRTYHRNGLLRTETLKVRTIAELAAGGDSTTHVYASEYTYDRNGRRTELRHPGQLAPREGGVVRDRTGYVYDPVTGALAQVTDPLNNVFRYRYDARGRQESLELPGGIRETFGYDNDGRATTHTTFNGSTAQFRYPGDWIRDERLSHDLQGRITFSANRYGLRDTASISYSALGHLARSTHTHRGYLLDTDQDARHQQSFSGRLQGTLDAPWNANLTLHRVRAVW